MRQPLHIEAAHRLAHELREQANRIDRAASMCSRARSLAPVATGMERVNTAMAFLVEQCIEHEADKRREAETKAKDALEQLEAAGPVVESDDSAGSAG